jgi:putative ABC transport system substrate-binding protein
VIVAGLAALSGAEAQAPQVRKIGFLSLADGKQPLENTPFLASLRDLGYIDGQNVAIERRYASGSREALQLQARDLVSRNVDVIVAVTTQAAQAAQKATTTIPIVFFGVVDPVAAGLVRTLARPSTNLTGLSLASTALSAKRVELLQELVPGAATFGVLSNPGNPSHRFQLDEIRAAAKARGVALRVLEFRKAGDIGPALSAEAMRGIQALIALDDPLLVYERRRVVDLVNRQRLPAMSGLPTLAESGLLVAYGPDLDDQFRGAALYVHRILGGARPADLPVEQPTKFRLVVNVGAAKAIGLDIPPGLRIRADELLE